MGHPEWATASRTSKSWASSGRHWPVQWLLVPPNWRSRSVSSVTSRAVEPERLADEVALGQRLGVLVPVVAAALEHDDVDARSTQAIGHRQPSRPGPDDAEVGAERAALVDVVGVVDHRVTHGRRRPAPPLRCPTATSLRPARCAPRRSRSGSSASSAVSPASSAAWSAIGACSPSGGDAASRAPSGPLASWWPSAASGSSLVLRPELLHDVAVPTSASSPTVVTAPPSTARREMVGAS